MKISISILFFIVLWVLCPDVLISQSRHESIIPSWTKEAVWYQIFPERFRNGDPANDPVLSEVASTWPYLSPPGWQIHPWTSDWYKLQPWEAATAEDFYTIAGARRYGGDLQGVLDMLDYLTDLGITAIYFNPLFESPSHHKYDATFYHHIDDNFGPDPGGDSKIWQLENPADASTWQWTSADSLFLVLLHHCHERNIRVIIDGVFNHVGLSFWAFQNVFENQKASPFKDWFIIDRWDDPETTENEFTYSGWNGVRELPEVRETATGLAPGFEAHLKQVVRRWMDPNGDGDPADGIDGWRLDVAEKVNMKFWQTFRRWVKEINPAAFLIGEIWWEDWPRNKMFNAAPWLQGDVFDGVMNYRFTRAVKQLVIDNEQKISASAFADSIRRIIKDYPLPAVYTSQNLMDSHDVERVASQIVNPDRWLDHGGNPIQNRLFDVRKPDSLERMKQKLIIAVQMTMPGAPMIYYGDEAGMWGGDDPDCRKPMLWPDLSYEDEISHPFGDSRPADKVEFDRNLFAWTQKMISIRHNNSLLKTGEISFHASETEQNILLFSREDGEKTIWILANSKGIKERVTTEFLSGSETGWIDLITGKTVEREVVTLKPFGIMILKEL
ncbi:MAG: alpha-amylase [Calditrichaeota bacterium]|nr:glycoside hydrolase family 13 protein [Calditrichota bacterium]RQW06056.1 MAG: alpha-amylase [Calditrichota bacterium]